MAVLSRKKWLIAALAVITAVAVGVSIWALFFRDTRPPLAPDYAPQETEQNATPIEGDTSGEKLETPQGGGAVSLTYSKKVDIDISDQKAALLFANPSRSTQDMVLQLVIQDTAVIRSGRLMPGSQVTTLDLIKGAEKQLSPGGYEGKFVVLYYNRETGEKAMVNTEIPVTIAVTE